MSVQPAGRPDPAEPYEVIHLGGEVAAIVPLAELRRLRAVERHASREALEEAEIEATLAVHDEWAAARPVADRDQRLRSARTAGAPPGSRATASRRR